MIADFIRILRAADVRVSPAEAIDAVAVIEAIGLQYRSLLKHALSHSLAKTEAEKFAFDECFESYFVPPREQPPQAEQPSDTNDEAPADEQSEAAAEDDQAGDEENLDQQGLPAGGGEASAADGPPASLTQMIETNDQAALQAAMAEAASAAGVQEARLFTQQGMFSRRIIEAMGLDDLDASIRQARDGGDAERAEKLQQGRAQLFEDIHDFV